MARLWSCGFELNSLTVGVEITAMAGSPQVLTTAARSGTYGLRVNAAAAENVGFTFAASNQTAPFYFRSYIQVVALPTGSVDFYRAASSTAAKINIRIRADGKLELWNIEDTLQMGSTSTQVLSTGVWYRLELLVDTTTIASTSAEVRLDGVSIITGTANLATGINRLFLGQTASDATLDMYFDDVAVNDTTGSFQNSWVGSGRIIHLRPNAAGDSTQWTPLASTNFSQVQEVTPDDATTYVSDTVLSQTDLYNVDNSGIGVADTVNVVQVGGRFRNPTADATTNFKFEVEKTTGGTLSQSASITPNTTTWGTNTPASTAPILYPITLYQDPDAATWTQTTLDSMQIGVITGTIGVFGIQLSTIWALVDYTPASNATKTLAAMGVG